MDDVICLPQDMLDGLLQAIDQTGAYVYMKDTAGRYTYVNQKVQNLFRESFEDIIGRDDSHFFNLEFANELHINDRCVLDFGEVVEREEVNIIKSTGKKQIHWTVKKPVRNEHGRIIGLCGISTDITERKRMEDILVTREQESRTLIENSPDTIARYDGECRRIFVNPAFAAMVDGGIAKLLGKKPSEYPGGLNLEIYETKIKDVLATGKDTQFELKWQCKDGEEFCSHIRLTAERDMSGTVTSVLGVGRDITELNDYRTELKRSGELLRELQIIAGLGSYVLDIKTGLWESSDVLDSLFGIDGKFERSVEGWESLIYPDDRTMMGDYFKNHVLGKSNPFVKEYRITRHNDQAVRWVNGLGKLEFDIQGRPVKLYGTIQDITDQKETELALRIAATAFETQEGMTVTDADGTILRVNSAFTNITGYAAEEIIGVTSVAV
jgi:PAS domain S-box-containing protein